MDQPKFTPIANQYVHLAGTTYDRSGNLPRLYLGPNHLLIMQLKSTRETARRFYYSDITALRCQPTRLGYVIDGAFIATVASLWIIGLTSSNAELNITTLAVTATIIAVVALLVNGLRGPTCKTWLHTANHTEQLSCLRRYHVSRRALAKLHERIVEAQEMRYDEQAVVERNFEPYGPPTLAGSVPETVLRPHDARWMTGAFAVSLLSSLLACMEFFYGNRGMDVVGLWTALVSLGLGTTAILRSYDTDCPPLARKMCAYLIASAILSIPIIVAAMAFLALNGIDPASFESIRDLGPGDGLQFFIVVGLHSGTMLFDTTCALIGLRALFHPAGRSKAVEGAE